MDRTQLVLLALLLGAVVGGSVVLLIAFALRVSDRQREQTSSAVPDGVVEVLRAMADPAFASDTWPTVLAASAPAGVFGLHIGEVTPGEHLPRAGRPGGAARKPGGQG